MEIERIYLPRVQNALLTEVKRMIKDAESVGYNRAVQNLSFVNPELVAVISQMHRRTAKQYGNEVNRHLTRRRPQKFCNACGDIITQEGLLAAMLQAASLRWCHL